MTVDVENLGNGNSIYTYKTIEEFRKDSLADLVTTNGYLAVRLTGDFACRTYGLFGESVPFLRNVHKKGFMSFNNPIVYYGDTARTILTALHEHDAQS